MTFQKSQTICRLEWENVAGCSQFYLEIFFLFPCCLQNQVIWISFPWGENNKHTFGHLLIWLSSQDADADLLGTYLCMCTFVSLAEWNLLTVLTASQDEPKK